MYRPLRVSGIVNDSITDGPGLRLTVFVQGCDKSCEGCHNPETQCFEGGKEMNVDEIFSMIVKNPLLSGVTLSGGEPFCQAKQLIPLARKVKEEGLELAAYTGNVFEELLTCRDKDVKKLASLCDIIVDGPFVLGKRNLNLKFRGSENQRIIDVAQSLAKGAVVEETSSRWN